MALSLAGGSVDAQTATASNAVAPLPIAERPEPPTVEKDLARAEGLFQIGKQALGEGRESDARDAFDAALDVFVVLKAAGSSDPRLAPAYAALIEKIHDTEVSAGNLRQTLPPLPFVPAPAQEPTAPTAAPEQGTLADLGARIEQITPSAEARETNAAVLGSEVLDLPIEMNDQVLGAIDLYSGRFKAWFSRALSRGLPHLPRIREILAEAGIPQDLAYVPIVESAFNPAALSRAKAKGLWQFIPSTGKQYGLRQDFFVDERSSIEKATFAAARYLKNLYGMFGDWNLALAGYNAGEGNVMRAIRRSQTNDFWALARTRSFRKETKNYVPLIHAAIVIAKSPESYGIDLSPDELQMAETIKVAGSYPITTVARCANTDATLIREMNPELRRGMTPSTHFDLKVPHGLGDQITTCLAGERTMNYTRHVVRKRDTLSQISKNFGVSAAEIARVNGLSVSSRLKPGTELAIPRSTSRVAKVAVSTKPAIGSDVYRIRKGDTLSSVAAQHGTTVAAIKALNGLRSTRLSIGQLLRLSSAASDSAFE